MSNNLHNFEISLYIHIPFCVSKCGYCDFYSLPIGGNGRDIDDNAASIISRYIDALGKEWEFYVNGGILASAIPHTIYVGGGTPSILNFEMWDKLDNMIFSKIDKSNIKEWSVECNPESFTVEKARMYAKSGVTRLTFGVQSLSAKELSICGRAHSASRALEILSDDRLSALFNSLCVDIVYALPEQTVSSLNDTLISLLSIQQIKHLSAYELTIAPDTPFGRRAKTLNLPNDELSAKMYRLIEKRCAERGMARYEISNYALPGFESVHNKAYWSHKPYIGLGAAAHSYIHPKRFRNATDIDKYISSISTDKNAVDFEEVLSDVELFEEAIFLGLRNIEGIDAKVFADNNGDIEALLKRYADDGLIKNVGQKWTPTSEGMLFADMMARELMR